MLSPSAVTARHAGMSPAAQILCPLFFFLTDPWDEENRKARGAESGRCEKKANRERREARLKHSQCKHSAPLSAASAWHIPKRDTHSG